MMSDSPTRAAVMRCGHWRCRTHRVLSVLDTGGVIFLTNRWPIPCRNKTHL